MIQNKINQIISEIGSAVIVLKGFSSTEMSKLSLESKYFDFEIDYLDKVDLNTLDKQVVEEVIRNRIFEDEFKWMTIEEFQLFKRQLNINNMPIAFLENNLYDKQYPYADSLSNIEEIYRYLYYQEDKELEKQQEMLLENVSLFYGQIDYSKESENYFVTYPENDQNFPSYKLYEDEKFEVNFTEEIPTSDVRQIELSDDEIPFLDLEEDILNKTVSKNIVLVLSGSAENLPHRYLERLSILVKQSKINLFFATLSIKRQIISNEQEYLKILSDVYGYNNFREIPFYKNIESQSKETVNISQAQIIDDIVSQAEHAMFGESFRDIYITASTGAGKSVMFQIPALYLAKKYLEVKPLTIVISPLIGLMNDQVDSMKQKGIHTSATINGNTPPFEREKVLGQVGNGEVDVLYLSPETLQARSDIKTLIGERNIGVVIIDEAHIVTTWGKSFRADYWYLGIYLAKLRKIYKFPIVTFTATAIYGGTEDMYLDTRNSLNMISPISYFGKVRRDDILMNVRSSKRDLEAEGRDYRKTKNALALKHLRLATKNKQKSLFYFPTIRLLNEFYNFVVQNDSELSDKIGRYYGTLRKEEKDEVLNEFKNNELQFVLATKAFGMGIDIPDITNVYHYAPTGNVVDYIQEIGRAARDKSKVPRGFGVIDFLNQDMNEVKQLHGMSAIRKSQILEVMNKVLSVYKEKGHSRNLIISPEDFKYIFVQSKKDENSLDNKVKTVLLMIEKDFSSPNKLGYSPFVARPRSLFGNDLIFVTPQLEEQFIKSRLGKFFEKELDLNSSTYSSVYKVNLSGIWEKHYKDMTYPSFKHSLFDSEEIVKLKHKNLFEKFIYVSGVEVSLKNDISVENVLSQYNTILKAFKKFLDEQKITDTQFTVIDLGNYFMKSLKISDKFEARSFAQTVINAAFEFSKIKDIKFIIERTNSSVDSQRYIVHQDSDLFSSFIVNAITNAIKPTTNYVNKNDIITSFHHRGKDSSSIDAKIAALGIGESRNLLSYQVIGGNNPQIYLRMNSVYPLEKAVKQGDFYQNNILQDVQQKHYTSVEMLKYLFLKEQSEKTVKERIINYSKWFWDNIENYFMGILPDEVKREKSSKFKF